MKKLSKNQMVRMKGGLAQGAGNRIVSEVVTFNGYAGNPCKFGRYLTKRYTDGSYETYSIIGNLVESCYL
ncbi:MULTISPECIES: hypothetical protein [Chryseobacterium]|uniref:Bacteriocin-like protein n=1 Tax=Chryseobacterium geocarposphaerae TaxID=1416776 RepID=A0ABU1LCK2_9FLAO|nr:MULTISPECIES: hypothetical protein [Chryseobacterium]MDR6404265.1 hypothetical protein [Chryseobacterium geocarposphaerae]MDR6699267.1 hypothetical protein [Chryseobacterium ginsenosidimutans]